jgi:Family of unknown function (DUF6153)
MHLSNTSTLRQLCVVAVLLGLVGMHGLASSEADGCHNGMGMTAAVSATLTPMPVAHGTPVPSVQLGMAAMAGSTCLFIQTPGWPGLSLLLLAIATITVGLGARRPRTAGDASGRSPPWTGMSVLRRVCVSLT